jgi:RHS repeat-associated protein
MLVRRSFFVGVLLVAILRLCPVSFADMVSSGLDNFGPIALPAMGKFDFLLTVLILTVLDMRKIRVLGMLFTSLFLCFSLSVASVTVTSVYAADGPTGPGWLEVQGTPVTPEEADAYYNNVSPMGAQALAPLDITPMAATTATPEISALARSLKNDPKLIYEYVRNNVDYVPYFGSLKGATLTFLDGSGNDFDQASLMISLLRASGYTAQYVYGTITIPASGDVNQKDMQHWLGVDANDTIISTVLTNGGIPRSKSGSNWLVDRVWVQATILGTNYLFDPAFKPHTATQGINLQTAMGYNKSALLSAAGGTVGTDYVQNLNEASLKSTLDGYTLNLANYIKANYTNAKTSDIIGGSAIVPQILTSLPTSLDFSNTPQYYWTDIPSTYIHTVRIQHGKIDQTLNIPDLAGQKLSIVYRTGAITTVSAMMETVTTDPQQSFAPLGALTLDSQPLFLTPAGSLDTTLPNISVSGVSIDKSSKNLISLMSNQLADFGSIYPVSAGTSSTSMTWTLTNPNSVTVQIVVSLTSNPQGAYSITQYAGTNNVGAGATITPKVMFSNAGQSAGTKTGQLHIQWFYNGSSIGDSYTDLTGYVANAMSISSSSGMGAQTYMNTPYAGIAKLVNSGSLPLSVTAKTLTGAGASSFQFGSSNDYVATTVSANSTQSINITYLANIHGTQSAYVHMGFTYDGMTYNASDFLQLQGQALYQPILTGSYGFNFGTPNLGYPVDGAVRLINAGSQTLSITGVSLTGTDAAQFTITAGNAAGGLSPGQYRDINVRYLANSVRTHTANVHVAYTYDGQAQTQDLGLSGQTLSAPVAQLWLDDTMLQEEAEPVTGVDLSKMTVSVTHPYSSNFAGQTAVYTLKRGSTYAVIYDFGGSRLGRVVEKRERQMQTYRESGLADTSRQVLTESLNVIGMTWMRDTTLNSNLLAQIGGVIDIHQHRFGVMAQESGYYIDVKVQLSTITSIHGDTVAKDAYFKAINHLASAMEHGVLEQMQSTPSADRPSVSTVKLLQLNDANGKKVFMVTSVNYATIKPQLSNYSTQDLSDFQTSVNNGNTLILPENGKIALQSWSGKGYIDFSTGGTSRHVGMIIGGGYNGGYGAIQAPVAINPVNAQINLNIAPSAITPRIPSTDPVDMATGYWIYNNTDLALSGGTGGLAFKRSYNSGNNNMKDSLGYGWSHNYRIFMEPHSSSPFGLGQRQPLDASALIVASVATLDVMNGTSDLKSWLTGALIGKWGMDNLTNNVASVHLGTDVLTFAKLPDGSFASPPGTTSNLVLNNGLYQVNEHFNRSVNFGADNNVSSMADADGNSISFTYGGGLLQTVSDNFGHSLTLHYTGALLTSVTDSASRGISYGYTGNDLTTYTDPEGKVWTYGPDSTHRILTLMNPRNITTVTNVYDTFGQVQSQTMPRQTGSTTYNLYFSGYRNIEEDGSGNQTVYYFDDQKHLLGVENALGQRNYRSYDGQNHVYSETDPRVYTTGYTFDGNNNLTTVTDPFSKSTVNTYDSQFRLTDVTDPLGHLVHTDFNATHHPIKTTVYPAIGQSTFSQKSYFSNGLVNTLTDGKLVVTTLTPDSFGNPASSKTSTAPAIRYVYDAIGRMTSLTDQVSSQTSFTYDKRSLLTGSTDPLNKNTALVYNDDGTLWKITDRNNKTTIFSYTPSGKTDTVTYQSGTQVSYTYNQNDFQTKMQDAAGTTSCTPDPMNRVASCTDPNNFTVSYQRDPNGNISKITYPGNKTVSYLFDALNRVKTVTIDWLGRTSTYDYDDAGRMSDLTQFNGTYTQYTHDNANRLTALENRLSNAGSAIATYSYTLDNNGNRTDIVQTVPIGINVVTASTTFTMNSQKNRLTQAGATALTYDAEGQLATKGGDTYIFDDTHRVMSIAGSVGYQYKYDGSGNRLEAIRNGVITRYIYDAGGNLLAEADGTNTIQKYYIYGNGLLATVTSGGSYYCYHFDGTGHTVALTDASANVVNKYAYTPFGAIANQQEAISQPFKYVGQYGVMTEPNGFNYMRARYYDPAVGRFISEDPTGFGGGDVNLMAYVGNQPINGIDPQGLWTISAGVNLSGYFGAIGGGGGTAINLGFSQGSGFSASLTGTFGGGAATGVGGGLGITLVGTNAASVNNLLGSSLEASRSVGSGITLTGIAGNGYQGGGLSFGLAGTSLINSKLGGAVTSTSAIAQFVQNGTSGFLLSGGCGK